MRATIKTLKLTAIAAFIAVQSPILIMMGLLIAAWTTGITKEQGNAAVSVACAIAKATYVYAPLCGIN